MGDLFNINSPKYLGGVNVHNTLALAGIAYLVYRAYNNK
jgi:hypothetical protein